MLPFRRLTTIMMLSALTLLTGCSSLAITALGVGSTAGVTHAMNGVAYKTFTAPTANVRLAALGALKRMGIKVDQKENELIKAATPERDIEIELETLSANTTRMRAVAKRNIFLYDSATAAEIIQQTEKLLKPQQR